jgi:hypothetical protein
MNNLTVKNLKKIMEEFSKKPPPPITGPYILESISNPWLKNLNKK